MPGCPDSPTTAAARGSTSANYGCAVNSNFAAMVADPQDLVLGQVGSVSVDGTVATKAIKVYRETRADRCQAAYQDSQIKGSGN